MIQIPKNRMNQVMYPQSDSCSFPSIPDSLKSRYGLEDGEIHIRRFGNKKTDLDVNFLQPSHPQVVTEVLICCTERKSQNGFWEKLNPDFFWNLNISTRIEALLEIYTLNGAEVISTHMNCSEENCGELLEISLYKNEILSLTLKNKKISRFPIQIHGKKYTFRKPTGTDQLIWQKFSYASENEVVEKMLHTLCVTRQNKKNDSKPLFTDEEVEVLNKEMIANDPLICYQLPIQCPVCNRQWLQILDLEDLLLKKLHKIQEKLLNTIHCLASCYHWNEQQILNLPQQRRAYYLSMIEKRDLR